jgi:hypothetical protein
MKKLLVSLLLMSGSAQAEFLSGNKLYEDLQGNVNSRIYALGYIIGVVDRSMNEDICLPAGVTQGQVQDVVINYMAAKPQMRNYSADLSVVLALRQHWPCRERKKS